MSAEPTDEGDALGVASQKVKRVEGRRCEMHGMIALASRFQYSPSMANVKKGQLVAAGEWWKHLRWTKRVFWKKHRQAERREATPERADG